MTCGRGSERDRKAKHSLDCVAEKARPVGADNCVIHVWVWWDGLGSGAVSFLL